MTLWCAVAVLVGCAGQTPDLPPVVDAPSDPPVLDAREPEPPDALPPDAPSPDALPPDAPSPDALPPDAQPSDAPIDAAPPDPPTPATRLRIVAGNLTSDNGQSYRDPGVRIFRGLAPDVALVQELNYESSSSADMRVFVDRAFGTGFSFVRGSGDIPNGVVSRYPILASGEWADSQSPNREYVWARIDIPGPIDLFAISVHLLTANSGTRNTEAGELVQNIRALPGAAYVVLGGDFNTRSRTEACITTLSAALITDGPFPVDQANDGETNASRAEPYDWVLANAALDDLETPVAIGLSRFDHGFVADTRVYNPIGDLAPALSSDSGASMMQHMAVVRDFELPAGSNPQPSVLVTAPNGGETWAAGSSQLVTWTATGLATVRVELSTDGASWTSLAEVPAAAGQAAVTVPALATTTARVRVSAAPDGAPSDVSDAVFTIGGASGGSVFINEILANEPGSNVAGEFVELVNSSALGVDLSGWTISDSIAVRHTFAAGTLLAAGRAIAVFGDTAGIPPGLANAVAASTHVLGLGNSGDTVTLARPGGPVDAFTYPSQSANDGVSINRSPDGSPAGIFVRHTTLPPMLMSSPGTRASGAAF